MEEGSTDRRAEQHYQPLGCKVMGGGGAGAMPGIGGYTNHQDRSPAHSVPSSVMTLIWVLEAPKWWCRGGA